MLEYKATVMLPDSVKKIAEGKSWSVKIFTNDTIARVETETDQLGVQVYIRNMGLKKAYLLLQLDGKKFAIQTNETKANDSLVDRGYTVKKKFGSKKILGLKCKKYLISDNNNKIEYSCYFAKKMSNKYLQVYPEVPFLAAEYFLPSQDGLVHYELISIKREELSRDLFGVPSDFQKISFEEFIRTYYGNNDSNNSPEK